MCDMPIYGWGYLQCLGMAFLGLEKWKEFSDFLCGKALPNFQLSWKKHQSMDKRVPAYMPLTMQKVKNQWTECMRVPFPMVVSKWRWKLVTQSLDHKTWRKRKNVCQCSSLERNFDHILIFHFILDHWDYFCTKNLKSSVFLRIFDEVVTGKVLIASG